MDTKKPIEQGPIADDLNIIERAMQHRKRIIAATIVVVALIVFAFVWYFIADAGARKADEAVALADSETVDSLALNQYIEASKLGHKSGNRAALEAAIALYKKGEYEQALSFLKDASTASSIAEAGRYSLMGDCYVNLNNYDQALSSFKKAYSAADGNLQLCPFILVKEANVYRAQGKYNDEYNCYNEIFQKYPNYANNLRFDIRKYAERAKANAQK